VTAPHPLVARIREIATEMRSYHLHAVADDLSALLDERIQRERVLMKLRGDVVNVLLKAAKLVGINTDSLEGNDDLLAEDLLERISALAMQSRDAGKGEP